MSTKPLATTQFFRQFPDDESCLTHLFNVRFGQGFTCPSCERPSNWYRIKAERAYSCQWCGHHLHPTVGTPFEQTRTPLQLWFYAIHLFTTTRHGVSAKELQRQLGVTYKTAWRMAGLIRQHMADVGGEAPVGGPGSHVEIDETLIGGVKKGKHNRGSAAKTVLVGAMERGGDVITAVVPNQRRATLEPFVTNNVETGGVVHTDGRGDRRMVTGLIITPDGKISIGRERKRHIRSSFKHLSININDDENLMWCKGMISFILSAEPSFIKSLYKSYGEEFIRSVARAPIVTFYDT